MTATMIDLDLGDEKATVAAGEQLGALLKPGLVLTLSGQLGAGKTTLSRGILQHLGHVGAVKSPTYTLVEPYESLPIPVYHFDLYRLGDPEELAYMGIRDYFDGPNICLIEWPDKGRGFLPEPDIQLELQVVAMANGEPGRRLCINALSEAGKLLVESWPQ